MFSKACEYAIKAAIFITSSSEEGERVSLIQIAKEIDSPEAYTAKVLQKLTKNNIVNSIKGPSGGFEIKPKSANKIKLSQIVTAIDGDSIYNGCALGFGKCNDQKPCPVHFQFIGIRNDLKALLQTTTLKTLSQDIHNGITFLKQ